MNNSTPAPASPVQLQASKLMYGLKAPRKPLRKAPAEWDKKARFNTESALQILNDFVKETRKEIRKNDSLQVSAGAYGEMCHLHFEAEGFELSFILKERTMKL